MKVHQPPLPSGFATFCDDVRYETNGKFSLIGVYSGEMNIFGESPAAIAMLWAVVRWRIPPITGSSQVVIRLSRDDDDEHIGEILSEATVPIEPPERNLTPTPELDAKKPFKMAEIFTHLRVSPLIIDSPCTLRVRVIYQGAEYRVGAMRVGFIPSAEGEVS